MTGLILLVLAVLMALGAPVLTTRDPIAIDPVNRLSAPSPEFLFGTDMYGRDVYARTVFGSRISLLAGFLVALFSSVIGLAAGLVSGFVRRLDSPIMRVMDGLMAVPGILLAIALMAVLEPSATNVIIALTVPQVPRAARLVRGIVLSVREQLFVEAAQALGAGLPRILIRHIMPSTYAPMTVQATFVCATAILNEAALSFLGAGISTEIPSWGNMMAEGKVYLQVAFWIILFPGLYLALTVLAINLLGDGLRDYFDPRFSRRA